MTKSKAFNLWTLVALVVGNAVGAGIYTTSGFSLADLGSREWVLLAWVAAGIVALMGAISYGMLVRDLSESGGEYLFLSRSVHPLAGFIAGWISLLAGFPGAIAFAASAVEAYLKDALPYLVSLPADALALFAILIAGIIHASRVSVGAKIHEGIVLIMLLVLMVIVLWSLRQFMLEPQAFVQQATFATSFNLFAFANALVWMSLSYSGFNAAAYIAGEVPNASHVVPKGMIVGTLLTMLLCILVNGVILYSSSIAELSARAEIAIIAANNLGGSNAVTIMQIVIAISLLTSITAMVLAGPRVYAKMAEDGALPRFFTMKDGQPPRASIALQLCTAILLVLIADLRELLSYLGLTLSLCLALAVSSLFIKHLRDGVRPLSKWYPIAPALFVLCTVSFAVITAISQPRQLYMAVPTMIIGAIVYFAKRVFNASSNQ